MEIVRWDHRPDLRRPVLLMAFEGWNDAGDAASMAVGWLARNWGAQRFASIDPEDFYDFTSTRPHVRLHDGIVRSIEWPTNDFSAAELPGGGRDVVFLEGVEPQLKWRAFCSAVLDVTKELDIELVVTVGALLAEVAHTRPVRVVGSAQDSGVNDRLALQPSRYEGPTGIVGVLHDALSSAGVASASLWASVPHYVGQTPSPKAALALVQQAAILLDVSVHTVDLDLASAAYERQVSEVVAADDDATAYVRSLEEAADSGELFDEDEDEDEDDDDGDDEDQGALELREGDALAAEVERFLRDQGKG